MRSVAWTDTSHIHKVRTTTPQPPQPPQVPLKFKSTFCVTFFGALAASQMMAGRDDGGVGSARRRRDRQFRAFRRHERLTVRMELPAALHHSAQPTGPVVEEPREVEAQHTHAAPRGQKEPPPGTRPGVLQDPEPQLLDAVLAYRAAGEPSVATPLLAAPAAEGVDEAALSFLLQRALEDKRKEEQLAKEKEEEEEEEEVRDAEEQVLLQEVERREWVQAVDERSGQTYFCNCRTRATRWTLPSSSSSGMRRRKRKKRSKKKLLKAPLPRCGRPCALQRQVPAVESALRSSSSTTCGHSCCSAETGTQSVLLSPGAVLGPGRCARVVQRQVRGFMVQQTVVVPQLQFIAGYRHPVSAAEADPHGPDYSADHRDSAVAVRNSGGRCPRYAGRAVSQVPPWTRHSCSHSCSSCRNCRPWFRLLKTAGFPQLQFIMVVHIPVVVQRPIPSCSLTR